MLDVKDYCLQQMHCFSYGPLLYRQYNLTTILLFYTHYKWCSSTDTDIGCHGGGPDCERLTESTVPPGFTVSLPNVVKCWLHNEQKEDTLMKTWGCSTVKIHCWQSQPSCLTSTTLHTVILHALMLPVCKYGVWGWKDHSAICHPGIALVWRTELGVFQLFI